MCFTAEMCIWMLERSESCSKRGSPAPCSGALLRLLAPRCHHLCSQTPVLDVPQSSRLGRGLGHIIDLAFVFLFKFGKAQARWPPLCAMPRRALCWQCHSALHCRPQCPVRGSGKSHLFLFYNITWFCKCCFLFQYLYFLLLKVL